MKLASSGNAEPYVFVYLFVPPHLLSSPFFCSLLPSLNSSPGSHSRLFLPPPRYGSCLAFLSREESSFFFPRRLASNCAYPRKALSAVDPFFIFANKFKISPRRDSNSRTSTSNSSIRGLQLDHRGDRHCVIKTKACTGGEKARRHVPEREKGRGL